MKRNVRYYPAHSEAIAIAEKTILLSDLPQITSTSFIR